MNWKKIWLVANHEFLTTMQRRSVLFMMFGMPFLLMGILALVNYLNRSSEDAGNPAASILTEFAGASANNPTGLIDESGKMAALPDQLGSVFIMFDSRQAARTAHQAEEIEGYFVVTSNFNQGDKLLYFADRSDAPGWVEQALYNHLALSFVEDEAIAQRLSAAMNIAETDLSVREEDEIAGQSFGAAYALATFSSILFYMTVMGSSGYLMQGLGKEKENRVMEILLSSLRPMELLTGKVVGLGAVGLSQLAIWGTMAVFLTGRGAAGILNNIQIPELAVERWALIFVYFILGFLVYASLFAAVGAITPGVKESGQLTFFLMFPTFLPLWFASVLLQAPNGTPSTIMSLVPLTSPIAMPMRVTLTNVPVWQIGLSMGLCAVTALATLWLGSRFFTSDNLLGGKVTSLRGILQAFRA